MVAIHQMANRARNLRFAPNSNQWWVALETCVVAVPCTHSVFLRYAYIELMQLTWQVPSYDSRAQWEPVTNTEMMQQIFREMDEDGSGSISIEEFEKYPLRTPLQQKRQHKQSEEDLEQVLRKTSTGSLEDSLQWWTHTQTQRDPNLPTPNTQTDHQIPSRAPQTPEL
eukprot:2827656-Amphidinium_carterae.1